MATQAHAKSKSIWDPGHRPRRDRRRAAQAASADDGEEPGDVRRRGRQRADDAPVRARRGGRAARPRLRAADHVLALAHGALRELRRGDGRGTRQGAGRHAAQGADRDDRRTACCPTAGRETVPATALRKDDVGDGQGRRVHPGRRRDHRRRRVGRRVGDHRRVGAGHPRVGRRPHRRSPAARACCRTGSRSASPRIRATRSSIG